VDENLAGGVANAGEVVRRDGFVLRPATTYSETVHTFLRAVRTTGFLGVPRPIEVQTDGRERLVFIEGDVALPPFPTWAQTDESLVSITDLVRRFHAASALVGIGAGRWSHEMADPHGGPIVCHNDVCLENVVFRHGEAVALLDFDFAAPGRPTFDLAALARMCVPIDDDLSAGRLGWGSADRPARLRLIADTYGLDRTGRHQLLGHLDRSMKGGGAFVQRRVEAGDLNFIRMLDEMGGMERYERRRRWWKVSRSSFAAGLA
jgi:aminoglycoside phosphotransferase (APT) family kinase protein